MSSMPPPPPPPNYGAPPPPGYMPYQQAVQAPNFAKWGTRVGGHLINGLVTLLFALPAVVAWFVVPKHIQACTVNGEAALCKVPTGPGWVVFAAVALAGFVGFFIVYARMIAKTGQAWGHKAVGVRIVDANTGGNIGAWKAFFRYTVGHWLDGVVCYLGYLWPLWDSKKQTFADKVFGTYSIKL